MYLLATYYLLRINNVPAVTLSERKIHTDFFFYQMAYTMFVLGYLFSLMLIQIIISKQANSHFHLK